MDTNTLRKVERIVKRILKDDGGEWDSLNHWKIILSVEEQFKVRIPDTVVFKLNSIERIVRYIERGKR